jgi:hypothetical protein
VRDPYSEYAGKVARRDSLFVKMENTIETSTALAEAKAVGGEQEGLKLAFYPTDEEMESVFEMLKAGGKVAVTKVRT